MPTSATGTSATRRPPPRARAPVAGFTLVEILVVVAIVGILCAAIMLSLNTSGRDQELEKESDRLVALFSYAREQAELQTREFGVMFADDGYEFLTYDNRRAEWRGVFEDDALAARKLPFGLTVALSVESRPVTFSRTKDSKDKTPQVMIYSNGDLTSFAATLQRDAGLRSITLTQDEKGVVIEKPMLEVKRR
jgi:general secretion pathway protein H